MNKINHFRKTARSTKIDHLIRNWDITFDFHVSEVKEDTKKCGNKLHEGT